VRGLKKKLEKTGLKKKIIAEMIEVNPMTYSRWKVIPDNYRYCLIVKLESKIKELEKLIKGLNRGRNECK